MVGLLVEVLVRPWSTPVIMVRPRIWLRCAA